MTFTQGSGGGGSSGDKPFGGTPAAVPGTVQVANYDTGGSGVAYKVAATNGTANSYRSDGVDLEDTADTADTSAAGGAYDMGWTTPGQWFNYTVEVATAGVYTVTFRVASPYGVTDALHIANSSGTYSCTQASQGAQWSCEKLAKASNGKVKDGGFLPHPRPMVHQHGVGQRRRIVQNARGLVGSNAQ